MTDDHPPTLIALDPDDGQAEHVGRTADGRQFFMIFAVSPPTSAKTTVTARDDPKPVQAADEAKVSPPKTLKPGDYLHLELLEALPGRPLSGIRGTVNPSVVNVARCLCHNGERFPLGFE